MFGVVAGGSFPGAVGGGPTPSTVSGKPKVVDCEDFSAKGWHPRVSRRADKPEDRRRLGVSAPARWYAELRRRKGRFCGTSNRHIPYQRVRRVRGKPGVRTITCRTPRNLPFRPLKAVARDGGVLGDRWAHARWLPRNVRRRVAISTVRPLRSPRLPACDRIPRTGPRIPETTRLRSLVLPHCERRAARPPPSVPLSADLPFEEASFDAVVGDYVVSHLGDPVARLARIRRVLRPGASWHSPAGTTRRARDGSVDVAGRRAPDSGCELLGASRHLKLGTFHLVMILAG